MTLAEFQPHVEAAVTAYEWATARERWRAGLKDEAMAIQQAIASQLERALEDDDFEFDREPYDARLNQILTELQSDVTPDRVVTLPLREVPMDMITAAVIRRILRLPPEFPVLSIKTVPNELLIYETIADIAQKWSSQPALAGSSAE